MSSRFPPIPPEQLSGEKKETHDYLAEKCVGFAKGQFIWARPADGALVGPFRLLLETPKGVAVHFFELLSALGADNKLSQDVREVAILTAGAHFGSRYELYAHGHIAEHVQSLKKEQIERVQNGQRPGGSTKLDLAYDVAHALVSKPGDLDKKLFEDGTREFGTEGFMVLVHYVSMYAYTSLLLNAGAAELPKGQQML